MNERNGQVGKRYGSLGGCQAAEKGTTWQMDAHTFWESDEDGRRILES